LNRITLHATDIFGNTATTNVSYTLAYAGDHVAPVLSVLWPTNGTAIAGSNVTVQAQVDDPTAGVTLTFNTNTVPGLVERTGAVWFNDLPLDSGTNTFILTATDAAGNRSTNHLTVLASAVNLTLTPLTGGQLNRTNVTVSGTLGDSSQKVTVNGVAATVSGHAWTAANVPVSPTGTAALNVQVTDAADQPLAAQSVYQPQPAAVVLAGYQSHTNYTYQEILVYMGHIFYNVEIDDVAIYWSQATGGGRHYHNTPFDTEVGPHDEFTSLPPGANGLSAPWENVSARSFFEGYAFFPGWPPSQASGHSYAYTQTHVMIQPSGQQSIGQTALYLVQAQVTNEDTGLRLLAGAVKFMNQLAGTSTEDVTNADGSVWSQALVSAPAGVNVEVTPQASGNISFTGMRVNNVTPAIAANGITLDPDTVVAGADFCVGQPIQFDIAGLPGHHYQDDVATWKLPGTFVNTNSDPNCDLFYTTNTALLTRHYTPDKTISTYCWYVKDGQQMTVSVDVYYDYYNAGKIFKETLTGRFNVHRPATATATPYQPDGTPTAVITNVTYGVWMGKTITATKLSLSLGDGKGHNDMSFAHTLNPGNFSGKAGYVQLITSADVQNSDPQITAPLNYIALDGALGEFPRGTPTIPANTATGVSFFDGPAAPLPSQLFPVTEDVSFSTYLMFRPDPQDSSTIWVPLRLITWEVHDSADPSWTPYNYSDGSGARQTTTTNPSGNDNESTAFPDWTTTY